METKKVLKDVCVRTEFNSDKIFMNFDLETFLKCPKYFTENSLKYEVIGVRAKTDHYRYSTIYYPRYKDFTGSSKDLFERKYNKKRITSTSIIARPVLNDKFWDGLHSMVISLTKSFFGSLVIACLVLLSPLLLIKRKSLIDLGLVLKSYFKAYYEIPVLMFFNIYIIHAPRTWRKVAWYSSLNDIKNAKEYGGSFANYINNQQNKEYTNGIIAAFYNMYSTTQEKPLNNEDSFTGF